MQNKPSVLLAFDFGMKRIGMAIGQSITQSANPLPILKAKDGVPDWQQVASVIEEWGVEAFIVGLPYNMDGTEQLMTHRARKFGNKLAGRFNKPVFFVDERLTTIEAKSQMHEQIKGRSRFEKADSIAAVLILESWFSS